MHLALRQWLATALLCLPCVAVAAGTAAIGNDPVSRQILKLEQGFNDAYGANELAKYFGYYADDLVVWFPDGRSTLAAYRKEWTDYVGKGNKLQSAKFSDMVIRVSPGGDEATASYLLAVSTRLADGKNTDERFQETDIWLNRAGKWQVAHVHYSAVPPAAKP
jgi:ketosteroid isomerase-like protein